MGETTNLRRAIDVIQRIYRFFSSVEPAVRHNAVLAKWEQYHDAHPTSFTRRKQYSALSCFTSVD